MQLPSGTVTFLFTDIEGSTRLWEEQSDTMRLALARHDALLREAIEQNGGHVFKTVGDAFCAAFQHASEAVQAAASGQTAILAEPSAGGVTLKVRMALHTGSVESRDSDYFGQPLNRVARLLAIGHGGQILLSSITAQAVAERLPRPLTLLDLGNHRLKDLLEPEAVHQLIHPELPPSFPPLRSLQYYRHNLPCQLTSFIGREKETADVQALLSKARLVTLTGAGGTGKTRLALQTVAELIERYADGVWIVELAALADSGLVAQTVAAALGVQEEPGRPLLDTLLNGLREKKLLILLDNCEHVIEDAARVCSSLLRTCPEVQIIATSREVLQVEGEFTYRVPSLGLPEPKRRAALRELAQYGAVKLFQERAAASAQFTLTPENLEAVVQICRRLDGIPLAIELAAARVRSMPIQLIAQRLDDRFSLLNKGSRTALPRQQTLRALIEWSWDLLSVQERVMLRRVSVFSGGWSLEAAEAVCIGEATETGIDGIEVFDVLDLLSQLVDKSLVILEERQGVPRYRLIETIRSYAAERLREAGEEEAVGRRHFQWCLALALEAEPQFDGPNIQNVLNQLELEHDNMRAALSSEGSGEDRLRLASAIHRFWLVRGYFTEGRSWLESSLRDSSDEDTTLRARALNSVGILAWRQGDFSAARPAIAASLELRMREGNQGGAAGALNNLGLIADDEGDTVAARGYYEEAVGIYRLIGDRPRIGMVLANLGSLLLVEGDLDAAASALEEHLVIAREIEDPWCTASALHNLGVAAFARSQTEKAVLLFREALTLTNNLGDTTQIVQLLIWFGRMAAMDGDAELAVELFGASESLRTEERLFLRPTDVIEFEQTKTELRLSLPDEHFSACWTRGYGLTGSDAVQLALTGRIDR